MNTSRLTINNIDLSTVVAEETSPVTGYTVVRSKSGSSKPVKFSGSSRVADFKAIFGEGGKAEPDVYEALTFLNAGYDLYVSAPYSSAEVPIAAVTNKGVFMLSKKIGYSKVEDFATGGTFPSDPPYDGETYYMAEVEKLGDYFGVSVESLSKSGFTLGNLPGDDNTRKTLFNDMFGSSVKMILIKKGGTSVTATGTLAAEASGKRAFTFGEGQTAISSLTETEFSEGILYVTSGTNVKADQDKDTGKLLEIKGYLFPKFPTIHDIDVSFVPPAQTDVITIGDISNSNVSFGLNNVDSSQPYICYSGTSPTIDSTLIKSLASLTFRGCTKSYATPSEGPDPILKGWEYAKEIDDNIDLFFDPICHEEVKAPTGGFFSLANTNKYMGLAGYIFNYTPANLNQDTAFDSLDSLDYGPNYWNICNQAVINPASENSFYSSMVGARAAMQARIIEKNYGGSAPMYTNDANGLGGQLGTLVGSSKLRYSFKNPELRRKLANKHYNVVVSDPNYRVMITSQMTCKSGPLTDWSYIGHACAFLNLEKLIWDNVMIPQIGKANNPYYRDLRAQQVQRYLDERTGGSNSIWAAATVDTSTAPGVNDMAAQKARKFIIVVKVKVNVFSEEVVLNFVNLPQDAAL